jgi:hypothetical protein
VPVRVARRQRLGCDETLIGEGRWHPDVDDDRVGLIRFDVAALPRIFRCSGGG